MNQMQPAFASVCPRRVTAIACLMVSWCLCLASGQEQEPGEGNHGEIVFREGVAIDRVASGGRLPFPTDAIQSAIFEATWNVPVAGSQLVLPNGDTRSWQQISVNEQGWFEGPSLRGGYLCVTVESPDSRVMILDASGHGTVYVNGEPRVGDVYRSGYVRLPVKVTRGPNQFLFHCSRGGLRGRLVLPASDVFFDMGDTTLPDLLTGEPFDTLGSAVLVNATDQTLNGFFIHVSVDSQPPQAMPLPAVPPLSVRKVKFRLAGPAPNGKETVAVALRVTHGADSGSDATVASASVDLRVRDKHQTRRITFESQIDGSIQYYGVNPASADIPSPALFLALHGAGVEGIGHVDAYASKSWGHLIAPTNRRPFGFDWEDWGRLDALEVLDDATARFAPDPARVFLTGHSMGGHGTWHLGATFPARFAGIGPSAGWSSFFSYAGARDVEQPTPVEAILQRAVNPSRTLELKGNHRNHAVYVLHGDADDNVPVSQARTMKAELEPILHDLHYHEQPNAGHWWNASDEPGTDCVDWAPMFDLFARRVIPRTDAVRYVRFTTMNPGISAGAHWARIDAQITPLAASSIDLRYDPHRRRIAGTTSNVARLVLLPPAGSHPDAGQFTVELDGHTLVADSVPELIFERLDDQWQQTDRLSRESKGPHRAGPFKDAFRHRMLFVYGTQGTPEESAWGAAKARFDAEQFWYRGNGSVDIMADIDFDTIDHRDRGIILYGNADTNSAWNSLLADSPIEARRGSIRVGDRTFHGEHLACLFLRPRIDSDRACIGVVTGSGLPGLRLTERIPYFVSGIAYPDWTVFDTSVLSEGSSAVLGAGFFGNDWTLQTGDAAWRDVP